MVIDYRFSNTILEVNLDAISSNYRTILKISNGIKVSCVLKADAYGFGLKNVAPVLLKADCRDFFVTYISEAVRLKKISKKLKIKNVNIYVLINLIPEILEEMVTNRFIPVLRTVSVLRLWVDYAKQLKRKLPCIIKFDTGMNRFGLKDYDYEELISLEVSKYLNVMYIMSHLGAANIIGNIENKKQINNMKKISQLFKDVPVSLGNSYALYGSDEMKSNMIRVGRFLYGEPDSILNAQEYPELGLKQVVSVKTTVMQIKHIKKNEVVGYNIGYVAEQDLTIAIVGIGYSDGCPSAYCKGGHFLINGRQAKILGFISMEYTMCDITEIADVSEGDEVTVIGEGVSFNEIAGITGIGSLELINNFLNSAKHKEYKYENQRTIKKK